MTARELTVLPDPDSPITATSGPPTDAVHRVQVAAAPPEPHPQVVDLRAAGRRRTVPGRRGQAGRGHAHPPARPQPVAEQVQPDAR